MKKYDTIFKKSKQLKMRESLFNDMERKEIYYNHTIPELVVKRTLKKYDLRAKYHGHRGGRGVGIHRAKAMHDYLIVDRKGTLHGVLGIGVRSKKVDHWHIY